MNQGGRIDSWTRVPSTVTGVGPIESSTTWNGRVWEGPRQKVRRGFTASLAKVAVPGSAVMPGGRSSNSSSRSGSTALSVPLIGALPRLSMARSCDAPRLPRDVRGASSAKTSLKAPISSAPSSTTDPSGSSFETTWTPNGSCPAGT
jgi:hypothetical protein